MIGVHMLVNLKLIRENTVLAAERDRAIMERDQAWRKVRELETALREARNNADRYANIG